MNSKPRQLYFEFDDRSKDSEADLLADVSAGEVASEQKSKCRRWQVERPASGDRATDLLESSASIQNLREALLKVARNKGAPGPDRQSVEDVVAHKAVILPKLAEAMLNGSYQPGDIRRCWIPKSSGGRRGLGIPNVVDRIAQEAVRRVLEPIFERTFHPSSHGFRPGRSCHTAIAEASEHIQEEGLGYVVDIDLKSFFDHVSHQRLLDRLQHWIADLKLVRLIGKMLRAKVVFPDGQRKSVNEGVPQGGPLSPLLSNIVLDELDWELERRGHRFVRYADDCNIYIGSLRAGDRVKAAISRFISKRLRLVVNEEKSAVAPTGERHFLGFRVSVALTGELMIELSRRSRNRIYQRLRELILRNAGRSLDSVIKRVNSYFRGWFSFFSPCTKAAHRDLREIDAHARRRLRAIFVWRYRNPGHLFRALIGREVPRNAAGKVIASRRGPWWKSHSWAVDRAFRNSYFVEKGLITLMMRWNKQHARSNPGPEISG